ncbi:MAG: molybdopterin-dependent oxidoreductase [Pseudomonadales bacterium]|nr:molybdopterin-dependent oxidoreductase [Pseudomonadales bacterium]
MNIKSVSRREFLSATGKSTTALILFGVSGCSNSARSNAEGSDTNLAWMYLAVEGAQFRFIFPRSEMGQDVVTSFSMMVAEEMDFPLNRLLIEYADANSALGQQMTVGSSSVSLWWNRMREVGAYIRASAVALAASQFSVPAEECSTKNGVVYHVGSQRQVEYLDLIQDVSSLLYDGPITLKANSEFDLIGCEVASKTVKAKVSGSFDFVADLADSKTVRAAVVIFQPGWPVPSDAELASMKVEYNLIDAFTLNGSLSGIATRIALLAQATWPLLKCKRALEKHINSTLPLSGITSKTSFELESDRLNLNSVISKKRLALTFSTPAVAHAPMEPESALVEFDGRQCEIWAPTQAPQHAKRQVADFLTLNRDDVELHTVPIGGSFGRKRYNDFVIETAWIAQRYFQRQFTEFSEARTSQDTIVRDKKVKVQLVWTREDDLAREYYRHASAQLLMWDRERPEQILHQLCLSGSATHEDSNSASTRFDFLDWNVESTGKKLAGNFLPGIWRAVEHGYLSFAICSFVDELSYSYDADPMTFFSHHVKRLGLVERLKVSVNAGTRYQPQRLLNVIDTVKTASNWEQGQLENRAMGFASYRCFGSYIALVVNVTIEDDVLAISNVWAAVDCGVAVNPNGIRAQIEGGIIYGLSACLMSEIPFKQKGLALNFQHYRVARMKDAPKVEILIDQNQWHPTGVGELGVVAIGPAIANAVRKGVSHRFLRFPFLNTEGRLNLENAVEPV